MAEKGPAKPPEDEEKKIHVLCATCQHYKGVLPVQYQGTEPIPPELIDPESLTPSTPFVHICSAFPHLGGIPDEALFSTNLDSLSCIPVLRIGVNITDGRDCSGVPMEERCT